MSVDDFVADWGGFEKLVATLHETGEVTVEHNATLVGKSGAPRQIDVLIRHKQGLYEHLVVAECKYWNSPVERLHVDALANTVREVGASRGVIFSVKGFQSGAIAQAKQDNINLYVVRELTAQEWGLPGRVVDMYLQVIQMGFGNFSLPGVGRVRVQGPGIVPMSDNEPINFNFEFDLEGPTSRTTLITHDGSISEKSLEQYLYEGAQKSLANGLTQFQLINGGAECTTYILCPTNLQPTKAFLIPLRDGCLVAPTVRFDLGIKVAQSRLTIDRAKQYKFAFALEDYVTKKISAASRAVDAAITKLVELNPKPPAESDGQVFVNGSIIRAVMKGLFPIEEMAGLQPTPIDSLRTPIHRPSDPSSVSN
jgi:Restriction endonuclease